MDLIEVLDQVRALLQSKGRVTYRLLQAQFQLSNDALAALTGKLIDGEQVARDEGGKVLVWAGEREQGRAGRRETGDPEAIAPTLTDSRLHNREARPEAERRQLPVMFCDLVGSTALSAQLDPEDLREVVRSYQETCAEIISRYEGYIAQYLGDGLLVYFGYPTAHEDDAARAVRVGLKIIEAMRILDTRLARPLHVRIGIHTGPVVVGTIGGGRRQEQLALGKTPNHLAARIQGQAAPVAVMISTAIYRLVEGLFACEDQGCPKLKGVTTPLPRALKGESTYRTGAGSQGRSSRAHGAPLALGALPHSGHIWERLFASFLRHHSHNRSAN